MINRYIVYLFRYFFVSEMKNFSSFLASTLSKFPYNKDNYPSFPDFFDRLQSNLKYLIGSAPDGVHCAETK